MTNNEFKAWFDGFTECMDKAPTAKQWARIKEKVKTIDGTLSFTQYITRYVDRYPHPYGPHYYGYGGGQVQSIPMNLSSIAASSMMATMLAKSETTTTDADTAAFAIAAIGRREFSELQS